MCKVVVAGLVVSALVLPGSAWGEEPAPGPVPPSGRSDPAWTFEVGPGLVYSPRFPGARRLRPFVGPAITVRYKELATISAIDGVRVNLLNTDRVQAGPLLDYQFPRKASYDRVALTGLHEVPLNVRLGAVADFRLSSALRLSLSVQQGLFGHGGLTASGRLEQRNRIGRGLYVKYGPFVDLYGKAYSREYFGVTAAEAGASRYARFEPGAGGRAGVAVAAQYPIRERFVPALFVQVSRLLGDAARSPIVRSAEGSATQVVASASLTYRFTH